MSLTTAGSAEVAGVEAVVELPPAPLAEELLLLLLPQPAMAIAQIAASGAIVRNLVVRI